MSTQLAIPPTQTLWKIEEDLQALLDTVDLVPDEDQEGLEQIKNELTSTLERAVAKRDQVGAWMAQQESTVDLIEAEIARLRSLKDKRTRAIGKVEEYVASIILAKGPDQKGRFSKLDGAVCSFSVKRNPAAIEIIEDAAIPEQYQAVTLAFSPGEWQAFADELDMDTYAALSRFVKAKTPNKTEIKRAIEAGEQVPGAQLAPTRYRLVRE